MGFLFDPVELKPKIIRVSGATKDAIDTYRNLKIPLSRLISDYYIVKANRSLVKKNNPWIYYHKGILKKQYEVGASVIEDAFNQAAVELVAKKKEPTDVINAAFYSNKNRNDSAFELSFLLPLFFENTAPADRILVVNPSPDVIRFAEEMHTGEKSYLVTDETIANLYKMEFPESVFFAFDQFEQVHNVDRMLVINRDQEKEHDELLLSGLQCCNDHAAVLLCVPSVWFDSSETAFSAIRKNGFSIETIVILDTAATASTPRKKILVQLDRDSHSKISLYMSHYDKASKVFSVCPQGKSIYTEQFAKKKKSILSLWNQDVEKQKEPRIKQTKQYFFSKEISLFYAIYPDRKNRLAGFAFYRKILNTDPLRYGQMLYKRIEKGLRGKSEEQIISALENVPFYNGDFYHIICDDLIDSFTSFSLKSLWYLLYDDLKNTTRKYNDTLVKELFSSGNNSISDFIPGTQDISILLEEIAKPLSVSADEIPFKVIEQLNLIFDSAVRRHLIARNPLVAHLHIYTQRATERQQDVRQALVKKHLTDAEEKRILKYLLEETSHNGVKELRVVADSIQLAGFIRLFTGMAVREVAALQWHDFREIDHTGDYQFAVNKYIDDEGKPVSHAENGNLNRLRIVPVTGILRTVLLRRKSYLISLGIKSGTLDETPIILKKEEYGNLVEDQSGSYCKPKKISDACRKLIEKAEIPKELIVLPDDRNEMRTDIFKYLGDLFLSNFTNRAKNIAGLSLGELNYIVGIDAPDTFSKHYCDYSNDFIQYGIIQKLERWTASYRGEIEKIRYQSPAAIEKTGEFQMKAGPFNKKNTVMEMIIQNQTSHEGTLSIAVAHGAAIDVIPYGRIDNDRN